MPDLSISDDELATFVEVQAAELGLGAGAAATDALKETWADFEEDLARAMRAWVAENLEEEKPGKLVDEWFVDGWASSEVADILLDPDASLTDHYEWAEWLEDDDVEALGTSLTTRLSKWAGRLEAALIEAAEKTATGEPPEEKNEPAGDDDEEGEGDDDEEGEDDE